MRTRESELSVNFEFANHMSHAVTLMLICGGINLLLDYVGAHSLTSHLIYAGSGFKSKHAYRNGYFATRIKLPAGYTAGTNTAFYVSTTTNIL